MWHLYGFSPLWILLCTARFDDVVNRLPQTLHSNGLSPEWLSLCTVNSRLPWKQFPHSLHWYLLLWTFICILRYDWLRKRFSHWVHEYQFSSVCWLMCCVKVAFVVYHLPQTAQWYGLRFSSVCLLLCLFKFLFCVNRLLHTVHKYGLGLSSRGCSVTSLLSTDMFISNALPAYGTTKTLSLATNVTHFKKLMHINAC